MLSREIQLLPEEETRRRKSRASKLSLVSLITGGFLLAVEVAAFWLFLEQDRQRENLAAAAEDLSEVLAAVDKYSEVEQDLRLVEENLEAIQKVSLQGEEIEKLLAAVEETVPEGLALSSLVFEEEKIKIGGQTQDYVLIFYFIRSLKESEDIGDVLLDSISRDAQDQPAEFRLSVVM